jgi:heme exporter protein D
MRLGYVVLVIGMILVTIVVLRLVHVDQSRPVLLLGARNEPQIQERDATSQPGIIQQFLEKLP